MLKPAMDWHSLDGKEIEVVCWSDNEAEQGRELRKTPVQTLILCVENMGDRAEIWVVVLRHGHETARHNAKMIETIVWSGGSE